ncbi:5-hydroxytryptamine receptor 3A-like [Centroberyx affinis]|uniref:5-hydroxytryptamine receptor 3A-like n=1 Tax=Centroberyx affinis TaxID=166261 RepID=UPI003A5C6FFC
MRPVSHWNQSTEVKVDMYLMGILNVDEKSQTVTTFITLSVMWNNKFLKWDPSAFCGIHYFTVPREKLWKPDIVIHDNIYYSGAPNAPYAMTFSTGDSQMVDSYRPTTTCNMDLYKFPFDTQTCPITFRSMAHTMAEIVLSTHTSTKDMNAFVKKSMTLQGEWKFVSINITKAIYPTEYFVYQHLIYTITLKRTPLLYIMNLVVPIIFFLILDLASFFISEARGEKLGFKVTILLSISVLLLIFQDILPSTSKNLPLIALLCIVIFILTGLSLLETMVVSFLVDLDGCVDEDGKASSKTGTDAKQDAGCQQEPVGNPDSCLERTEEENSGAECLSDRSQLGQILEEVKAFRHTWFSTKTQQGMRKAGYWKRLARRIDNIYFCFYLITTVAFLGFMYIKWFC